MNNEFMNGFVFNEDNSVLYMVNTKYHIPSNDVVCFNASCLGYRMKNKKLAATYEIMRADVECSSNGRSVSVDFNENGRDEFRVYKVLDVQVQSNSMTTEERTDVVSKEKYCELREAFVDFVCSGVNNPAPYCKNRCDECVDSYGYCTGIKCNGFNPDGRTYD